MGMAFGGSQGTVRYGVIFDTAQAQRSIGTFKAGLASIAPTTQKLNQQMGTASTGLKTMTADMTGNTKAAQQMATQQTALQASIAKTTSQTKLSSAENAKLQQQIFKTSGVTQSFGSKIKEAGSKFSTLSIGLSATATSALQLGAGFRDYNDAQIAVDRMSRRLSLGQEALGKAQTKLNDLTKKGVTSGKAYEQAQLDVTQAQQQVEIQTQLVGEAQERMFDAQTQFVASVVPTVLGAFGTITSAVKDVGLNMDKLKGGIGGLKGALGGLGGLGPGLGLVGPIGLAVAAGVLLIMKLEEMKKSVTDAFHSFKLATVDVSFLQDPIKAIEQLTANTKDFDEILKRVGAKSMLDLQAHTKEYIKTAIDLGAVVDKTGHFMQTTTDRTFKLGASFKESTATWIHWMEMYKEKGETPIQILERLKKAGMDEATAKKVEAAAEEDYQNKLKAGMTITQQATKATQALGVVISTATPAFQDFRDSADLGSDALENYADEAVKAVPATTKLFADLDKNTTSLDKTTNLINEEMGKTNDILSKNTIPLMFEVNDMVELSGQKTDEHTELIKKATQGSEDYNKAIEQNWKTQDTMNSMNDENIKMLNELNLVYGTNRTVMNTNIDMIGKLHKATIGVRDAYIDEEFSLLALAEKYGVATVKMQDMTLNYVDNTREIKNSIAANLDWSAAFTDLNKSQELFDEGVFKGVVQLKEWADNVVIADQQAKTFKQGLIDLGNTVFANAIPKGIQLTVEQMESLITTFKDTGRYAEAMNAVLDTVFSESRSALQELVDAATKGGKDFKEAWKDVKKLFPKSVQDDAKKFYETQGKIGSTLEKVIPTLEVYRGLWDSKNFKISEQSDATDKMASALKKLKDPLDDIAGTDISSKIIDPLLKLKEGGLTKAELNTWDQFFNLFAKLSEEGGGISPEDLQILQDFVDSGGDMNKLSDATKKYLEQAGGVTEEQQKWVDNKKVKSSIDAISGAFELQQTYIEGVTGAINLQGQAVRGLTKDFNQLVLIMQKMVAIKPGGGGGGGGFTNVVYPSGGDGEIPSSPESGKIVVNGKEMTQAEYDAMKKTTAPSVDFSSMTKNASAAFAEVKKQFDLMIGRIASGSAAMASQWSSDMNSYGKNAASGAKQVTKQFDLMIGKMASGSAAMASQWSSDMNSMGKNTQSGSKQVIKEFDKMIGKASSGFDALAHQWSSDMNSMTKNAGSANKGVMKEFNKMISKASSGFDALAHQWSTDMNSLIKNAKAAASGVNKALDGIKDQTVYINYVPTGAVPGHQLGFHGIVSKPYLFVAGEAGPERVDVTPGVGKSGGGGGGGISGGTIVVNLTNVVADRETTRVYRRELGKNQYRFGPS
jgi:hypothetical protein